jgi:hypothetical protein
MYNAMSSARSFACDQFDDPNPFPVAHVGPVIKTLARSSVQAPSANLHLGKTSTRDFLYRGVSVEQTHDHQSQHCGASRNCAGGYGYTTNEGTAKELLEHTLSIKGLPMLAIFEAMSCS